MENFPVVEDQQLAVLQMCQALLYALAQPTDTLDCDLLYIVVGENKELFVRLALSSFKLLFFFVILCLL